MTEMYLCVFITLHIGMYLGTSIYITVHRSMNGITINNSVLKNLSIHENNFTFLFILHHLRIWHYSKSSFLIPVFIDLLIIIFVI